MIRPFTQAEITAATDAAIADLRSERDRWAAMARVFQKANTNFVRAARNMIRAATERAEKAEEYFEECAEECRAAKTTLGLYAERLEAEQDRVAALEGALKRIAMGREVIRADGTTEMVDLDDPATFALAALSAPPAPAVVHASDCAVHNAPALPPGPCDCGADPAVSQKVAAALKWSAENKPGHGLHDVPGVGLVHFNDGSGPSPETLARWERDEDMSQAAADVLAERRGQALSVIFPGDLAQTQIAMTSIVTPAGRYRVSIERLDRAAQAEREG